MGISIINSFFHQNQQIDVIRIENSQRAYVDICTYGATLMSIVVPDRNGSMKNVILGYENPEDYLNDNYYLGSTVGRVANRISGAAFNLDGVTYELDKNDGINSNHGGFHGFNKRLFQYQLSGEELILSLESKDGEGGFPGNLRFSVSYSFNEVNELLIKYSAISNKDTYINPTNHAYFNLSGENSSIWKHTLSVVPDKYLEMNDCFLPTGNVLSVKETAFDFSEAREIGEKLTMKNEVIKGYNTYFALTDCDCDSDGLSRLASLKESVSGRCMDLYSSMPGFMLYTGDYLSDPFKEGQGVCLEAQYYPDGMNHKSFIIKRLKANLIQEDYIKYRFYTEE